MNRDRIVWRECLKLAKRAARRVSGNNQKARGANEVVEAIETKLMKMKALIVLLLMAASIVAGSAQPAPLPDPVSNATIGLASERVGLSLGASSEFGSGDPRAIVALDYSFPKLWFLRAEAQTGSDQVVRSIEAGGGIYKMASPTVRIYGVGLLGYDWERTRYDFSAGGGAAWQPFTGEVLSKVSAFAESRVVINLTHPARQAPDWLNAVGFRYSF